jgi:hypothetical protein
MIDKANSVSASGPRPRQVGLSLSPTVFSEQDVRLIIDEWLVPLLVDEFFRSKIPRTGVEEEHNGEPLP